MSARPTVIVLAAGRGQRFLAAGGQTHKLQALMDGKTVLQHTLDAVSQAGLSAHVVHAAPERRSMGDSIVSGIEATSESAGWLLLPADLPLVEPETLRRVAQAVEEGAQAARPRYRGQVGHPVGFAASRRSALLDLRGFSGAATVFAMSSAIFLEVNDEGCVMDVDTPDALQRATLLYERRKKGLISEPPS